MCRTTLVGTSIRHDVVTSRAQREGNIRQHRLLQARPLGDRSSLFGRGRFKTRNHQVWGGALPLPRCLEADIERSDKPRFALGRSGVRFDTVWAMSRHSPTPLLGQSGVGSGEKAATHMSTLNVASSAFALYNKSPFFTATA